MSRVIVALSGGKASAWCADWALKNFPKDDVILYFNDTKWEHKDLYRFLNDLEVYFDKKITYDSDGRSVEDVFYDNRAIASNRMPFCSRILKAERLQKFYKDGDILIFGIGPDESHRATRIIGAYDEVGKRKKKWASLQFPLIANQVTKEQIDQFLKDANIEEPELYKLGFSHNNCSGGCVRAGKKQWKMLYEKLPEVYKDRERMEKEFQEYHGRKATIFADESLEEFRLRIESGTLSKYYYKDDPEVTECIGICSTTA